MPRDPMVPNDALLIKLASIVGHIEEWNTTNHYATLIAAISNIQSPEVREWMQQMRKLGLAPIPRTGA